MIFSGDSSNGTNTMKKKLDFKVIAQTTYLVEQSVPTDNIFIWTYQITITNNSNEIVQLLNRFWHIIDMADKVEEVQGPGVIGLQPIIKPKKKFSYNSFCQLATPQGTMEGHYEMQTLDEEPFLIEIPRFELIAPKEAQTIFRSKLH